MLFLQNASIYLSNLQYNLFPQLEEAFATPLTDEHDKAIKVLEIIKVEEHVKTYTHSPLGGRPPYNRRKMARAMIVRHILKIHTMSNLINRLEVDRGMRRICGWLEGESLPSESTFSRAIDDFANEKLFDEVHLRCLQDILGDSITEHISYDSTAIPVYERPEKQEKKPPKTPKKRGRPAEGDIREPKELTRLQKQLNMTVDEMISELPVKCSSGCKKNSHGDNQYWSGYKFHVGLTCDNYPVVGITTGANMHDSGAAIPMIEKAYERTTSLYDLMDSAYYMDEIKATSLKHNHVPIIDVNLRSTIKKKEQEALSKIAFSSINIDKVIVDTDRKRRYKTRTSIERFNSRLKNSPAIQMIRVRGHVKVHALLMSATLVILAETIIARVQ